MTALEHAGGIYICLVSSIATSLQAETGEAGLDTHPDQKPLYSSLHLDRFWVQTILPSNGHRGLFSQQLGAVKFV